MKVGYCRVSTRHQDLSLQKDKLLKAGCEKIFEEKISGASRKGRVELENVLDFVREGDVLIVTRLDRLARSLHDLTNITKRLENQDVGLIVTDQAIDTTSPAGRLLFHMIGAIAEFERDLITERTSEGRARAKDQGVKFGRKNKLSEEQIASLREEAKVPGVNKSELMRKYGIGKSTFYRIMKNPS